MKKHTIYVVFDASKMTKVGMTSDMGSRMASYRTTNPSCELAATITMPSREAAREIEHLAHRILHKGRRRGEWFDYSVDVCVGAVQDAVDGWNLLMESRRKICGWGKWKARWSPQAHNLIVRHQTRRAPPTEGELVLESMRRFVEYAKRVSPDEFVKALESFSLEKREEIIETLTANRDLMDLKIARCEQHDTKDTAA